MNKFVCFALVFALSLCLSATQSHARGGGGKGGARPGGGRPGGNVSGNRVGSSKNFGGNNVGGKQIGGNQIGGNNFNHGNVRDGIGAGQFGKSGINNFGDKFQAANKGSRFGEAQNKASALQTNFSSKNEPFSSAWYADHPGAWQYTHPHADAWAVATAASAAAWLGVSAYGYDDTTVLTSDTEDNSADDSQEEATEPVSTEPVSGAELAARGNVDVPNDAEFLPMGVFALAPAGQVDATAVVQLAMTKDGVLRGSYCDLITDQGQTIFGAVDKPSQRVAWTIGRDGQTVFETTLPSLTQAAGPVSVSMANGNTRPWTLARFEGQTPATK